MFSSSVNNLPRSDGRDRGRHRIEVAACQPEICWVTKFSTLPSTTTIRFWEHDTMPDLFDFSFLARRKYLPKRSHWCIPINHRMECCGIYRWMLLFCQVLIKTTWIMYSTQIFWCPDLACLAWAWLPDVRLRRISCHSYQIVTLFVAHRMSSQVIRIALYLFVDQGWIAGLHPQLAPTPTNWFYYVLSFFGGA